MKLISVDLFIFNVQLKRLTDIMAIYLIMKKRSTMHYEFDGMWIEPLILNY